jgi:hypothetical protein
MIDYTTAHQLALDEIARHNRATAPDFHIVLVEESTLEEDIGWVFSMIVNAFLKRLIQHMQLQAMHPFSLIAVMAHSTQLRQPIPSRRISLRTVSS